MLDITPQAPTHDLKVASGCKSCRGRKPIGDVTPLIPPIGWKSGRNQRRNCLEYHSGIHGSSTEFPKARGVVLRIVKTIGASISVALSFFYLGCGSVDIAQAGTPNISQIVPQTLSVGSSGATVKVVGSNFSNQTVVLWNGAELPTTMVDGTTLSSPVQTASLSIPGTAQLQVQNFVSGAKSVAVPMMISAAGNTTTGSLSITTTSLPSSTSGTPYSVTLAATGGTPGYTWSITSGKLPAEMSLVPSTGVLSGTPSTPGSFSFGVAVSDQSNPVQTKSATLTFVVLPKPLTITTTALPSTRLGVSYSQTVAAVGGTTPYHWSITSGTLPPGLSLTAAKGILSGTPTAAGNFPFAITVTDKSGAKGTASLAIQVIPSSLSITTSSLAAGTAGVGYSSTLAATGGTPGYTWSLAAGSLPPGLTLAPNGTISGVPTTRGTSTFTVNVNDSSNPALTQSATETIVISASPLQITTSSLPSGSVGAGYSSGLTATGGTAAYTWSITAGSLPAGLTLASNGTISGTPTTGATSTFTVSVHDSGNPVQTQSATETIVVSGTALKITSSTLPSATVGTAYSSTLAASGGTPAYTWSITAGSLPAGLTLASTGTISGTPTTGTATTFTVSVHDSGNPVQTQSASETITFSTAPLKISTTSLPSAKGGQSYSQALVATGGTLMYKWAIASGSLPTGLSLSSSTGVISGVPTSTGTSVFTTTVSDSSSPTQMTSAAMTVVVSGTSLSITSSALASATVGSAYSQTLQASGGTTPYTWSVTSGQLPAGLSLSASTGTISGTPTSNAVSSSFVVTVTDSSSPVQTTTASTSIAVASNSIAPLAITSSSLPSGTSGTSYSTSLQATGGTPAYTWSITSGSLPAGLTMAATTGVISGTPTSSGTATFTATVHDNGSPVQTTSATTSINVGAASTSSGPGTTWFIRTDGGTRYSANVPTGQCDGKSDSAYPGSGTNQHCAFKDFRYMWDDQSYQNNAWVMAGGDTVIIRGCAAASSQQNAADPDCRIGWDANSGTGAGYTWCYGGNGPYTCTNPTIPAGTATQHTRILGQNYANCSTANATDRSKLTQIFGGFGVLETLNLTGAQNVDVECLEITTHNGKCVLHGSPLYPRGCNTSSPLDDYDGSGIWTDNKTSNVLLQDVYIHGHGNDGLFGPIGGQITMTRVFVGFNGFAGWNFDDGHSTPDAPGSSIIANYVTMEGNGCNEQYPIVNAGFPAMACYDDVSNGFGDSWSGQDTVLDTFTCNHCVQMYNTKDGFIGPHTQITHLLIENSASIGNMGQQWKWNNTPYATTVFRNNLTVGNCLRMTQQLPGAPQSFALSSGLPGAYLSDYCRAAGDIFSFSSQNNSSVLIANNTVVGYSSTVFDLNCGPAGGSAGNCGTTPFVFKDNLFLGYTNPNYSPTNVTAPGLYYYSDPSDVVTASNNIEYGIRNGDTCGGTNICLDPLLINEPPLAWVNELELDNLSFHPSSSSPAVGAGVAVNGLTTDYYGVTRPNPPSIGAVEP